MNPTTKKPHPRVRILAKALLLGALSVGTAFAADINVTLSGANEVPPVTTSANGGGTITIGDDGSVSGSVSTTGIAGTAAHIHNGATGANGPVIVPFTKEGDTYTAPAGAKLTEAQMASFKAGDLYVNVHSAANPGGEIRGQLK
jgi:CHRD domain